MSNNADANSGTRQIPVNLFTRSEYAIPASTYFIPAEWRRFQLSELINKVLGHGGDSGVPPVPFDFVVEGEVLRGSLDAWIKANRGDDEETALSVEYMQSVLPPSDAGRWEQEDWVSGLSVQRRGMVLVSSYLSHVRVLPLAGGGSAPEPLYTLPLPTALGATCCVWLEGDMVAAGGVDRATHVFRIPSFDPAEAAAEANTARELYTLMGHAAPISAIAGAGRGLVSAAWDGQINVYALPDEEPGEHELPPDPTSYLPGQKKRRKLAKESGEGPAPIEGFTDGDATGESGMGWRRAPGAVLRGHKGRVGGVRWDTTDAARVWSAGWDGSVRGWDAEMGANVVVRQGPSDKALLCVSQFTPSGQLAAGSVDRTVTLWDTREAASVIAGTLQVGSPVPSIACHPTSAFTLATATYAGTVQIWDVRSPKHALFSVRHTPSREQTKNGKALGERLLAVDWDGELLVAGGEDGEVGLWHARGE
ncbi:hypothetical protein CspeluHIS016_0800250 [Cutaneotrichosporon spelunceum]|uniref:NLE domain-containing protein n=1 Tax=Cutaneotrichosporon spelunceum TaxID=1672016 RepID=A0AAD3TZI8_9TREE|nr:hypothetical protein CspeluHIS016_0800250 [Cutaneotrichosporon spelunceum]